MDAYGPKIRGTLGAWMDGTSFVKRTTSNAVPSAERAPRGRGLNDTDLLANDSDGVSEFAREATLKKTTFPSNLQLQQMNLKDGVPWGMRGWWPSL